MTRTWHKVDCLGWLDGSIRTDLTIEERSIWADFLSLCGVSRVEGIICRGEGKPYDLHDIARRLNINEGLLASAIAKFTQEGMISNDPSGIRITKWGKYNPPPKTRYTPYQSKHQERQTGTTQQEEPEEPEEQDNMSAEGLAALSQKARDDLAAYDAENWDAIKDQLPPCRIALHEAYLKEHPDQQ